MAEIREVGASRRFYAGQRRNLYPFLSKEEMSGWMEDAGPLRIRWFTAVGDDGKTIAVDAWEVYDIHQYQPNGPRLIILYLYTMEVEEEFRGQGIGVELFTKSLEKTIAELRGEEFVVGALQIETTTARNFYEKVLSSLGFSWKLEIREMDKGHPIFVFWVPLLT